LIHFQNFLRDDATLEGFSGLGVLMTMNNM